MRCGVPDNVYEGENLEDGSAVAIKLPGIGGMRQDQDVQWFLRQAEELAYIDHPLVVPIDEIGCFYGQPFAVSALPAGTSLLSELLTSRPRVEAAIAIVVDLAGVLHLVHERWSMVHGDLNPRAIIVSARGRTRERLVPSILAICLSKREHSENSEAIESPVLRATPYMSPEQRGGVVQRVDVRSDVFSLGAILYHLLLGSPPPAAGARAAESRNMSLGKNGASRRALETVMARAMAHNPGERYQSAAAFASDLEGLGKGRHRN
jgi:serine/threonine-protein kinase